MVKVAKSFINKYPRIFWFLVGLGVSVLVSLTINRWADKTISEYKKLNTLILEEYKSKTVEQKATIATLTEENRTLKSKTKTYKLIKPDGTIEERTESETESEEQIASSVKEEYYSKLTEETTRLRKEHYEELSRVTQEVTKLNITLGITTDMSYVIQGLYKVYSPFTVMGGTIIGPSNTYMLGVGFSL